jgi:hypothetical protein
MKSEGSPIRSTVGTFEATLLSKLTTTLVLLAVSKARSPMINTCHLRVIRNSKC